MMNSNDRAGMSGRSWNLSLGIVEIFLDIIKGTTIVGGVISASLADFIMGAISINILFGASVSLYTNTPVGLLATVISVSASAFQIYLFALLQRRHIGLAELKNWKKIPAEARTIVKLGGALWLVDTFTDVAPILLLVRDSQYKAIPELWYVMIGAVTLIVFMICGFSELLTSNMRTILQVSPQSATPRNNNQRSPDRNDRLVSKPYNNPTGRKPDMEVNDEITSYLKTRVK